MPRPWLALPLALFIGGLASVPAGAASQIAPRARLEYLTLERPRGATDPQAFTIFLGAAPVSRDRFLAEIEQHGPDFPLTRQVHGEQAMRGGMLWGGVVLLALLPVVGATYYTNYTRNASGVFTRTWMGITLADGLSAVTLLTMSWLRKDAPLFNFEQAQDAARAYNERIEGRHAPGAY